MVLSNSCIAQAVEEVEAFFESSGISGEDQIRLRLLIENALLTYQSCMGEDAEFEMFFRKAGMHKAVFSYLHISRVIYLHILKCSCCS